MKARVFRIALLAAFFLGLPTSGAAADKPNIIFIMADDLGQVDLGCYGQKNILTPRLDRMAAEGVRFTQCYAGATVCAPSRSVLMTGLHTGHTRVRGNSSRVGGVPPQGRVPLRDADVTVAEVLKKAGYTTGITGKWGLGEPGTAGTPNKQGFDEWLGFLNQRHAHTYYPEYIWRNDQVHILSRNIGLYEGEWVHDLFTKFALDFIGEHHEGPFFLYLAYTIPHGRYEVPDEKPYSDRPWPEAARQYAAMVTRLDSDVGKIFDALEKLDIDERTIVFFCSDNGATFLKPPIESAGPLRGRKGNLYEGGIRTPMIVRWPSRIAAGRVSDQVWAFWDFLPTAAELAGAEPPAGIDGISMVNALVGKPQRNPEYLYWEHPSGRFSQAVRYGRWKGVRPRWGGPIELYDLEQDLGERSNVADSHPEVLAKIDEYMKSAHVDSESWPVPKR